MSIDAKLMAAYCESMLGNDGRALVERAASINPSAPRVMQYRVMVILSAVAQLAKKNDRNGVRALLPQLEAAMDKVVAVLGPDDAWTLQVQEAVRRVQAI